MSMTAEAIARAMDFLAGSHENAERVCFAVADAFLSDVNRREVGLSRSVFHAGRLQAGPVCHNVSALPEIIL